jgi:hypothetical protein
MVISIPALLGGLFLGGFLGRFLLGLGLGFEAEVLRALLD